MGDDQNILSNCFRLIFFNTITRSEAFIYNTSVRCSECTARWGGPASRYLQNYQSLDSAEKGPATRNRGGSNPQTMPEHQRESLPPISLRAIFDCIEENQSETIG